MKVLLVFGAELQRDTEQTHRRSCWYIRNSLDGGPTKAGAPPGSLPEKEPRGRHVPGLPICSMAGDGESTH